MSGTFIWASIYELLHHGRILAFILGIVLGALISAIPMGLGQVGYNGKGTATTTTPSEISAARTTLMDEAPITLEAERPAVGLVPTEPSPSGVVRAVPIARSIASWYDWLLWLRRWSGEDGITTVTSSSVSREIDGSTRNIGALQSGYSDAASSEARTFITSTESGMTTGLRTSSCCDMPESTSVVTVPVASPCGVVSAGRPTSGSEVMCPVRSTAPTDAVASPARASVGGTTVASWYGSSARGDPSGDGFIGNRTACGVVLEESSFLVAHRDLPCGTLLEVSHGERSVLVRVGDRGPYIAGRELDLTRAVRDALGCTDLCSVEWQVVEFKLVEAALGGR